jgi:hypothetical protein
MIEAAFFIPVIMFLLLAAADLAHIVQLTRGVDRAAAFLADDLAQRPVLAEGDFDTALLAAGKVIGQTGFPALLSLETRGIRLHPLEAQETLWTEARTNGAEACVLSGPGFTASAPAERQSAAINYFVVVDLCAKPASGFFLSGLLSVADFRVHGRAISVGRTVAVRGLD